MGIIGGMAVFLLVVAASFHRLKVRQITPKTPLIKTVPRDVNGSSVLGDSLESLELLGIELHRRLGLVLSSHLVHIPN